MGPLLRILTDRGGKYCGNREHHEFELYLDVESIEHIRTRAKSLQTNGICERFHQTIQNEFYASVFRRKRYHSLDELPVDLDAWLQNYNAEHTRSEKYCYGKAPMQTFIENAPMALDKPLGNKYSTQQQENVAA